MEGSELLETMELYDAISSHFSSTRQREWPEIHRFLDSISSEGGIALDLGCGNGRHMPLLMEYGLRPVGLDISESLLAIARNKGHDVLQGTITHLPFRDSIATVILAIAVVHHLSRREDRVNAMREMARVLSQHGVAVISVWARKDMYGSGWREVPWHHPSGRVYIRHYYFYTLDEFRDELSSAELDCEVERIGENLWALCRKGKV